jgi:hypothetical protein
MSNRVTDNLLSFRSAIESLLGDADGKSIFRFVIDTKRKAEADNGR